MPLGQLYGTFVDRTGELQTYSTAIFQAVTTDSQRPWMLPDPTDLTDRQIKDLRQAVMEMGSNAIEWGHRKNAELDLSIVYRIDLSQPCSTG